AGPGMSRGASPFSPRAILAVLVVGGGAFLLFLYAIGAGWTGRDDQDGGAHAAANGLNGFAGLVRLLEAQGHEVELSRSETRLQDEGLLVLTPPIYADGERIAEVIRARRYHGPTLVILPKWPAMDASGIPGVDARRGWVLLGSPVAPRWIDELEGLGDAEIAIGERRRWEGMGLAGTFPEPDLIDNSGLADRERARLAHAIVDAALEDSELPIVFDLTLPGLGRGQNLLTLAFRPPFLAATLALLLAALVVAWRAFRRFGPPVAEAPAQAMGKRQLARNGAALIERARRFHLLGPPYASLVTARLAEALGIRDTDPQAREAAVNRALAARGLAESYAAQVETLRHANHSAELLRAAGALRVIERTVSP